MLARFARCMYRRRRFVLAAWFAALVVTTVLASAVGGEYRADYTIRGSESAAAQDLLIERFPELSGDTVQLVFSARAGGLSREAIRTRVEATIAAAGDVAHVRDVRVEAISADDTVALVTAQLDATMEKVPLATVEELMHLAETASGDGLVVEAGGFAVQNAEASEVGSEQIGLIAALIILLIVFGSVVAAVLPIAITLVGIGVTLGCVALLQNVLMVPDWAPTVVMMISIGVGIDYALFIVTRYRAALRSGMEPEDAVVTAVSTAGRAVLFAGGAVVISLLGMCAMGMEYLYGTAAATITGVLVVLVASMTMLPATLGFLGHRIDRLRVPFVRGDQGDHGIWARWSRVVQRHPLAIGTAAAVLLVALAVPFGDLRFGYPDAGTGPEGLTSRRAYDLVSDAFGPGANGPLVITVDLLDAAGDAGAVERVSAAIAADPGIAVVLPARLDSTGRAAAMIAVPATSPQDTATVDLIHRLRDDVVPAALGDSQTQAHVGGATAAFVDEGEYLGGRLPVFIAAVIALSFVLLMCVFRSVLVALKAAIMNLLAIGAAYGVMAMALSGGWLGDLVGIQESTPIPAWAPMMMFALLFGLSMDYEVFLLSRIREEYLRTGDNAAAVAHGMARTGRVITAAAAIMVTVFGAFLLGDAVLIKVIGLGLATAVFLDATVVRMMLVPSTMELLGDRNWWMPRWLDRLLPNVAIEGHDDLTVDPSGSAVVTTTDVRVPVSVGSPGN